MCWRRRCNFASRDGRYLGKVGAIVLAVYYFPARTEHAVSKEIGPWSLPHYSASSPEARAFLLVLRKHQVKSVRDKVASAFKRRFAGENRHRHRQVPG